MITNPRKGFWNKGTGTGGLLQTQLAEARGQGVDGGFKIQPLWFRSAENVTSPAHGTDAYGAVLRVTIEPLPL